jgi:uncharacterized protein
VPQSYAEALTWYRKAADQGDADGQLSLGSMYRFGQGVPRDYAEAMKFAKLRTKARLRHRATSG